MSYIIDGDKLLRELSKERLIYPYNVIAEERVKEKLRSIIYSLSEQCECCSKRRKDHYEKEENDMVEYIDNGVKAVGVGDKIGFAILHTDETPAICAGIVFKKSGVYKVALSGNFMFVDYVGPNDSTCVGCRYNPGLNIPSNTCMTCSRRCADHYEKEENNE